ncbi:MAG TPA: MFS transporter [Candidatus Limnocylindrales bacterium]|nr:MFS transporter [Candidatus Limnocylindrales bacterium]
MFDSRPLRDNVDFRRYWLGQVASDFGTQLSLVAFPLLVLSLGGSPAQAGGIATGSLVARTVCRLPAGVLVDRWDRRRVMVASDLIRAVALGSIPLAALVGSVGYPQMVIVAIVEGAVGSVFWPAAAASIRRLVPPQQLTAAMASSQARVTAAGLLGPAIGGWLFAWHRLAPFVGDAVSYLVSALLIGRISTSLRPDAGNTASRDRRLSAGFRWFARHRVLRVAVVFGSVVNLISVSTVLAVVVSAQRHGHSATTIGLLLACVGAGSLCGALVATAIVKRLSLPAVFATLGAGWVATFLVLMSTSSPWVVGPVLAAVYLLAPSAAILIGKMLIAGAPEDLLGRITTAGGLLMSGLPALGPLLTGILLVALGENGTWLVLAATAVVATLACLPTLRTPERPNAPMEERDEVLRQAR